MVIDVESRALPNESNTWSQINPMRIHFQRKTRHEFFVYTQKAGEKPALELERSSAIRSSYWYRSVFKARLPRLDLYMKAF
ncbi:hypothetical protein QYM36_000824 [Artemia franciscana]|uniref:Uncharacterized protein n=1 Tax=Artemia franciscana TaxID=6661 RepID=A0AA88LDL0_ARTSF|nr:hypothetical protein QYM36_000824 [Artemia franciscana]